MAHPVEKNTYTEDLLRNIRMEDYTYDLPEERIAVHPLSRRDASRLLLLRDGEIGETVFSGVPQLLHPSDTLVFNNTRVIHARLFFRKESGALIEVFCLEPVAPADHVRNFAAEGACVWECMVGNLKKWKAGEIHCSFEAEGRAYTLSATRLQEPAEPLSVRFSWDAPLSFGEVLACCGKMPIPPYLNREAEEEDEVRYQTVYSRQKGSVAAPTAGLHFTPEILDDLRGKGITTVELTLHVGAGTFKPVKTPTIGNHDMHTEMIRVPRQALLDLLRAPGRIVAVGTTSVRTLESLYWMGVKWLEGIEPFNGLGQWEPYSLPGHHSLQDALQALISRLDALGEAELRASTTVIIVPGYRFRVVSAFFTNFHQPQSTLLLLVAAAVGPVWRDLYQYALSHGFRFLSYGDSSLLPVNFPAL